MKEVSVKAITQDERRTLQQVAAARCIRWDMQAMFHRGESTNANP